MSVDYAKDERVSSIRKKGIIYMILAFLAYVLDFIPAIGAVLEFFVKIIALIFLFLAIKGFAEVSGSKKIVKKFLIFTISVLLGSILLSYKTTLFFTGFGSVLVILAYILLVLALIFGFMLYKELSNLSGVSLFFIAFILSLLGIVFEMIPFLGFLAFVPLFLALICEFMAWIKLENINKASVDDAL